MIKQELIIGKIKKCCDDAIDCDDNCMSMTNEEYFRSLPIEKIARVLGADADFCKNDCPYRRIDDLCMHHVSSCMDARIAWLKQEREKDETL